MKTTNRQPNILLISLDAVRADHLSCYGYERQTTPFLNEFIKESIIFEKAYTAARWTLPSHTSLFTGMSNSKHGVAADWSELRTLNDQNVITLAEFLKEAGYKTAAFSCIEWVSHHTGLDRGFDHFVQAWTLLDTSHKLHKPIKHLSGKFGKDWVWRLNHIYEKYRHDKGAKKINSRFGHWIDQITQQPKPFFAFIHYLEAHAKYWPPGPYRSAFIDVDPTIEEVANTHIGPHKHLLGIRTITQPEFEILSDLYDGALLYLDHMLGQLLGNLDDMGILDDTMVIITADHGECFGEHGHYAHSSPCLHEPIARVPLIVRYPDLFPEGEMINIPVSGVDIFPTVVDTVGRGRINTDQLQGISLIPESNKLDQDRFVVVESLTTPAQNLRDAHPEVDMAYFDYMQRALRWRDYKYIWHSKGDHELYNLNKDPFEENNLLLSHTALAKKMQSFLDGWLSSFVLYQFRERQDQNLDTDVKRRLSKLGYIT